MGGTLVGIGFVYKLDAVGLGVGRVVVSQVLVLVLLFEARVLAFLLGYLDVVIVEDLLFGLGGDAGFLFNLFLPVALGVKVFHIGLLSNLVIGS